MIYELRTYTFQPGKQGDYLKLNAEVGRKVRIPGHARELRLQPGHVPKEHLVFALVTGGLIG